MKRLFVIVGLLLCIVASAQQDNLNSIFDSARKFTAVGADIVLESHSFRKTIESKKDVDSVLKEIFDPLAPIVSGGTCHILSVSTVAAVRMNKVSADAIDFSEVIKPGMDIYDLVWRRGDSELRSVAITNGEDIVYDNIGSRLLLFDGAWLDAHENEKELGIGVEGKAYAGKLMYNYVIGPFVVKFPVIYASTIAKYADGIIWQTEKPKMRIADWTDWIAEHWTYSFKETELAGGRACPDYAVLLEYSFCSKDYYAVIDGATYLIPKAEYSDKVVLRLSASDVTYAPIGEAYSIGGTHGHEL